MEAEMIFAAFETDLRSRRKSKTTMREYRIVTESFKAWLRAEGLGIAEVRRPHVQEFFAQSGWGPSTQRSRLTWLKAPWMYAVDELEGLDRPFPRVRLETPPRREPRTISTATLREIKAGIHDPVEWALFHLLAYTGMRRAEVASLEWMGVSSAEQTLTVIGKGNKQRTIPLHPELARALKGLGMSAGDTTYVIPGRVGGRLTVSGMDRKVQRMVRDHRVTCHDFRRTVASSLENNEAREAAIFQIMGWSPDGSLRLRTYTAISPRRLYLEILKLYVDDPL